MNIKLTRNGETLFDKSVDDGDAMSDTEYDQFKESRVKSVTMEVAENITIDEFDPMQEAHVIKITIDIL